MSKGVGTSRIVLISTNRNNISSKVIKVNKLGRGKVGLSVTVGLGAVLRGGNLTMMVAQRRSGNLCRGNAGGVGTRSLRGHVRRVQGCRPILSIDVRRGDCGSPKMGNPRMFCCRSSRDKGTLTLTVRRGVGQGLSVMQPQITGKGEACCLLGQDPNIVGVMRYKFLAGPRRTTLLRARGCREGMTRTITSKVIACLGGRGRGRGG